MTGALFPGSFNPITLGHLDVVEQAARHFDHIVLAVLINPAKSGFFSLEERIVLLQDSVTHLDNVTVTSSQGLVVDCARRLGLNVIIKGLRNGTDFDYEVQMAHMNRHISGVDTFFAVTDPQYSFISSSLVKQIVLMGGDISRLVPDPIVRAFEQKNTSLNQKNSTG